MKILITGICGFVGSTLARELLQSREDLQITGIDNFIRRGSEQNLEPLRRLGIDIRTGDLRFPEDLNTLPATDWVIDCAANPSVLAGLDDAGPKELLDHNLTGTIHMLEYCRKHHVGLILLSTSRVYSIEALSKITTIEDGSALRPDPNQAMPGLSEAGIAENFSADPPLSLYGVSKRASELLALEYGSTFDFPVWINRCGVLAGAGQFGRADQGIFSFWIHSWAAKHPLSYIGFGGRGLQVRDVLHPRDLVSLLVDQMDQPSATAPRTINVSGGRESALSLAELSAWCKHRLGPHEIGSSPDNRPFDLPWIVLDSSLAATSWNWQPATSRGSIFEEIARHAEENIHWLETV
jgi:CDP-paratose 2-epimerase